MAKKATTELLREPIRDETRVHPHDQVPSGKKIYYDRAGNPMWVREVSSDPFYIDPKMIPTGWTWEWKRFHTYNMTDPAHDQYLLTMGWRPVLHEHCPGVFGEKGRTGAVEIHDQRLYERPSGMTEDYIRVRDDKARAQVHDAQRERALAGPAPGMPLKGQGRISEQREPVDMDLPDYTR